MKKLIIVAAILALSSALSFASPAPPTPEALTITPITLNGVSSVLNGQIAAGTSVYAGVGQTQTQTTISSLTASSSVANVAISPAFTTSIVGNVSSVTSGTGFAAPTFSVVNPAGATVGVSGIAVGAAVTTITNFAIPLTTIVGPGNSIH